MNLLRATDLNKLIPEFDLIMWFQLSCLTVQCVLCDTPFNLRSII